MYALIWRNVMHDKGRATLTILSAMVAFALFGILAAAQTGFNNGIRAGSANLVVFNRISRFHGLPLAYAPKIGAVDGVRTVTYARWFGGYFADPNNQLAGFAVDSEHYFDVEDSSDVSPEDLQTWRSDQVAVVIGADLAKRYHWKIGQQVPVRTSGWTSSSNGDHWQFKVAAISHSLLDGVPDNDFLLHYKYLDRSLPADSQHNVSYFLVRITSPLLAASISEKIDDLFTNSEDQTRTNTTSAVARGFADEFANLGEIILTISAAVFFSLLLILANAHAQSVRERLKEWATIRAIGFRNSVVLTIVLGEAILVVMLGSSVGLAIAKLISLAIAPAVTLYLPGFYLSVSDFLFGLVLAVGVALLITAVPAVEISRQSITVILRSK
jgi:putative ABC transport system permease protein